MKWAVARFPGSLDDDDALYAVREVLGQDASMSGTRTRAWVMQNASCSRAVSATETICDAVPSRVSLR